MNMKKNKDNKVRPDGFYWVLNNGEWIVAWYETTHDRGYWGMATNQSAWFDTDFDKIGDMVELPKKYKK